LPRRTVRYYFAFHSPYAALADSRIDELVASAGAALEPVPVVPPAAAPSDGLAAQLAAHRMSYIREDAARWAERLGLSWAPPAYDSSLDGTAAAAGWYHANERGREREYRNGVFRARFAHGWSIAEPEVLADCAAQAGLDRADFLAALPEKRHHPEVPKALARCLQDGVFGVPFFVVDGIRFWGNDRLDFLLEELRRS
jgi:2-hydroxychromene-2-carboxylate isomerase